MNGDTGNNKDTKGAFLTLFMRHQKQLYNFILSLCPNYSQADDILQETATVMWEKFEELKDDEMFLPWSFQIARYKIMNHRRKKTAGLWLNEDVLERVQTAMSNCSKESSMRKEALQECLLKLPVNERRLIALRYEQNTSFASISEIMNRSVNGLYNVSAKIHQKLRICIMRTLKQWGTY